jgi:hypothetical protein
MGLPRALAAAFWTMRVLRVFPETTGALKSRPYTTSAAV